MTRAPREGPESSSHRRRDGGHGTRGIYIIDFVMPPPHPPPPLLPLLSSFEPQSVPNALGGLLSTPMTIWRRSSCCQRRFIPMSHLRQRLHSKRKKHTKKYMQCTITRYDGDWRAREGGREGGSERHQHNMRGSTRLGGAWREAAFKQQHCCAVSKCPDGHERKLL